MRRMLLSTCMVAMVLTAANVCRAQAAETKTVVTVSFSGYDELMRDAGYIGKLAGQPDLAKGAEGTLEVVTQGKGLVGLDKTKPWGAVVQTDGQVPSFYIFLPVKDLDGLVEVVKALPDAPFEAEKGDDGTWTLDPPGPPVVYAKQVGDWTYLCNEATVFNSLPNDPTAAFKGMDKKYDLAVRASIKNVPPIFRQQAIGMLSMGVDAAASERLPGESAEEHAIRKKMAENSLKQIKTLLDELDEVLLGLSIDESSGTVSMDIDVTAIPGTNTASQFAQLGTIKTRFAGVNLPGAAVVANMTGAITDADVAQAKSYIQAVRDEAIKNLKEEGLPAEKVTLATQILTDLVDVAEKTLDTKKTDGGFALVLDPAGVTAVGGVAIAEGAKLEAAIKKLVAEAGKDEPAVAQLVKLDAETYDGVNFHTVTVPAPPDAAPMVGDALVVVIGIGPDSVYVAGGKNAIATLKKVIDDSKAGPASDAPPVKITISTLQIAKFAAAVAEGQEKQMAGMIAALLEASDGKDHITLTASPITNGEKVRLEIEEGVVKMVATAAQMWQMQMMGAEAGGGVEIETIEEEPSPF